MTRSHRQAAAPACRCVGSGHPLADVFLLKYAPKPSELQEGVAFYGRAGNAILKSLQRLHVDPMAIYGTNCLKFADGDEEESRPFLLRELHIVQPKLVVVMGEPALAFLNGLGVPARARARRDGGRAAAVHADDRGALHARHRRVARRAAGEDASSGTRSSRSARGGPSCRPTSRRRAAAFVASRRASSRGSSSRRTCRASALWPDVVIVAFVVHAGDAAARLPRAAAAGAGGALLSRAVRPRARRVRVRGGWAGVCRRTSRSSSRRPCRGLVVPAPVRAALVGRARRVRRPVRRRDLGLARADARRSPRTTSTSTRRSRSRSSSRAAAPRTSARRTSSSSRCSSPRRARWGLRVGWTWIATTVMYGLTVVHRERGARRRPAGAAVPLLRLPRRERRPALGAASGGRRLVGVSWRFPGAVLIGGLAERERRAERRDHCEHDPDRDREPAAARVVAGAAPSVKPSPTIAKHEQPGRALHPEVEPLRRARRPARAGSRPSGARRRDPSLRAATGGIASFMPALRLPLTRGAYIGDLLATNQVALGHPVCKQHHPDATASRLEPRSRSATDSTCGVCGNMSTGVTRRSS